jgi:CubicO group peptidase (beta-lactamase class C family)
MKRSLWAALCLGLWHVAGATIALSAAPAAAAAATAPIETAAPGTTPAYSNYATTLAGYVVERAG